LAKNRRVKLDKPAIIEIRDWEHADTNLREIGDNQLAVRQAEDMAKTKIDEAKAELAVDTKPRKELINQITRSLEAFAVAHKADFKKTRSRKLNFGILGWRKTTSIKIKKTTLELIKEFFTPSKKRVCIRIKETVDKEALSKLTDEELASVKARRKVKDDFFVEPELPEAVDYG